MKTLRKERKGRRREEEGREEKFQKLGDLVREIRKEIFKQNAGSHDKKLPP